MRPSRHILTALAMIFMVSCIKMDRVYDSSAVELAFSPIGQAHSHSAMTKVADYPENGVFGLYAYYAECLGGTIWDSDEAWPVSSLYFDNASFRKNGDAWGGWDHETSANRPYYWPLDGSLMFVGYSPYVSQNGDTGVTSVSLVKNADDVLNGVNPYLQIGFTQSAAIEGMVDLLWFDAKDVNLGKTLSKTQEAVPVHFKHALSKVTLTFRDSEKYYRIKSVKMKGCVNSGTFYSGKTAGWMPVIDDLAEYVPLIETTDDGETVYPKLDGWISPEMLIIPQYLDGVFPTLGTGTQDSGVDVVLEFVVTDGFGEQKVEILMKEHTERWEIGRHYQYTITVNAEPIDFGVPSVTVTTQTVSM